MSNLSTFVKRVRDIMRNDAGINGDAQRIEQIAWMLFLKVYDAKEQDWEFNEDDYESIIPENCRWSSWAADDHSGDAMTGDTLLEFVNNTLFPTLKNLEVTPETPIKKSIVRTTFEDANQYMKDGVLLRQVINVIDELDLSDTEESHAFGEIYETILKELQSAGSSGEFYTPRAVTDFMAKMIKPRIGEKMADFACGTGGFLTSWLKALAPQIQTTDDQREYSESIYGIEKKQFPYMLCVTNMLLHDIDIPQVYHDNSLTRDVLDYTDDDRFDVILMNPPYGGSEKADIKNHFPDDLASSETSDLFMALIFYRLSTHGRCAVILPDGFLTNIDSNTKIALKRKLLTDFNLHTIIKLPNTTFAPYATVSTNILFFNAGGPTKEIWFYQHKVPKGQKNYSKTKPIQFAEFKNEIEWWNKRTENEFAWKVPVEAVISQNYKIDFKNPRQIDSEEEWNLDELSENIVDDINMLRSLYAEINLSFDSTKNGEIMTIGNLCNIAKGKSPIQKTDPGPYPMVVTAIERLTSIDYQFDCEAVCVPLVSSTGHGHASIKRIHFQEGKFALGNILCAISSKDENILLTRYLYIYLSHYKDEILVPLMKGTTNVSLNMKDIAKLEICVPDIDTQILIVEKMKAIQLIDKKIQDFLEHKDLFNQAYISKLI